MTIWSLIVKYPQSLRRFSLILLLFPIFNLMIGYVLAEEPSSTTTNLVISSSKLASASALVDEHSITQTFLTGRNPLLAQSQITPTITSYPAPLSPTTVPTDIPPGGTEEPYPDVTPDSIEQPLIPYPDSSPGQSPGLKTELAQTPSFQNPISTPAIGSITSGNAARNSNELAQTSSAVSTTILWIAFLASLLIFLSAILWSILYFSRHRGRE